MEHWKKGSRQPLDETASNSSHISHHDQEQIQSPHRSFGAADTLWILLPRAVSVASSSLDRPPPDPSLSPLSMITPHDHLVQFYFCFHSFSFHVIQHVLHQIIQLNTGEPECSPLSLSLIIREIIVISFPLFLIKRMMVIIKMKEEEIKRPEGHDFLIPKSSFLSFSHLRVAGLLQASGSSARHTRHGHHP